MNHKIISLLFLIFFFECLYAGEGIFQFLDLPVSSRMAALGGKNVSMSDPDINFALVNPALLNKNTDNMIGFNMANYLADIQFGTAIFGKTYGKNNFGIGVQYVDYGTFKRTNEYNEMLGEFSAKDIALSLIYSRQITPELSAGATLKPIYSAYESYISYGAAIDLGISYHQPKKFFSAGLLFRNIGKQIKGYYAGVDGQHYEPLPFDIQLGFSFKPEHAPFRLSLTAYELHHWQLNYINNENSLIDYDPADYMSKISVADMAFRHSLLGIEFLPGKNLYLVGSYNHRRHQELKMSGFKSLAGFSFGGGIRISKFQVGFGVSQFQVGNAAYLFSISTSLNEFKL